MNKNRNVVFRDCVLNALLNEAEATGKPINRLINERLQNSYNLNDADSITCYNGIEKHGGETKETITCYDSTGEEQAQDSAALQAKIDAYWKAKKG